MKFIRIFVTILTIFSITFAVNLITPIYSNFTALENKGNGVLTLVFSVYIIGMFFVLILFGALSDIWGRRNTLFLAQLLTLIGVVIIYIKPTLNSLFILRLLLGLSIGLSLNTATALLNQIFTKNNKRENLVSNWISGISTLGFGSGALLTGFYVMGNKNILVAPTYIWCIILSIFCLLGILFLPNLKIETTEKKSIIRLPFFPENSIYFSLTLGLGFCSTAIMISILPSQLRKFDLFEYNGIIFFLHTIAGVIGTRYARHIDIKKSLNLGFVFCPLGTLMTMFGSVFGNFIIICIGAMLIGFSAWGLFYFSILSIVSKLGGINKARTVAGMMFIAYLGFGIPAIIVGYISDFLGLEFAIILFATISFFITIFLYKKTKELIKKNII